MFVPDDQLATLIFDYCRWRLAWDPVDLDFPGDKATLERALAGVIGPGPQDPAGVLKLFAEVLAPTVISCDSPRFLAFIRPPRPRPRSSSTWWCRARRCRAHRGWKRPEPSRRRTKPCACWPTWPGCPNPPVGCSCQAGSAGNLSALVVARDTARHRLVAQGGRATGPLRVAVSDQAHSSIGHALRIIGMDPLVVPTTDHRLTGEALARVLDADPDPASVVAVAATAGTTNAGIVDDLAGVGEVANDRGLWMHVDGAYGGAALFARSSRRLFAGIERADSFVVDPHKWLFAPFDCAALIYRQPHLARVVHTQDASYLDVLHTEAPDEWNPSDYAYHLTRRARGLALWFSLAVNGTDAYCDAVEGRAHDGAEGCCAHPIPAVSQTGTGIRSCPWSSTAGGLVPRAVLRLVSPTAGRPGRLRDADRVGGRDGKPTGLPPPRYHHRNCPGNSGHYGLVPDKSDEPACSNKAALQEKWRPKVLPDKSIKDPGRPLRYSIRDRPGEGRTTQ